MPDNPQQPDFLGQAVRQLAQVSLQRNNLAVIKQHIAAMQAHDIDTIASLLDDSFVLISDTVPTPTRRTDRQGYLQLWQALWKGFPDAAYIIVEDPTASDDKVSVIWRGTGTHRGEFVGVPPTGRKTDIQGGSVYQVRDGKIITNWDHWDTGILLRQLGIMP